MLFVVEWKIHARIDKNVFISCSLLRLGQHLSSVCLYEASVLNLNSLKVYRIFSLTCFLVITRRVCAAPCCFLKRWHLCLCSTVGGSAWPLRWWSHQSHVLHVNRSSAQFQGPRLSEHKSHQTTLGPEKTSTAHANVLRFGFPQQRCGVCTQWITMIQNARCSRVVLRN